MTEVCIGGIEATDRKTREIEGIAGHARELRADAQNISARLCDMRSRLLGLGEPEESKDEPDVKAVVSGELDDLRGILKGINSALIDAKKYIADLEAI